MRIEPGSGTTQYGPGVDIHLDGNEVATAILAYLMAHGVHINGLRTVTVNYELCRAGKVYVEPSGFAVHNGVKYSGRGSIEQ